MGDRHRMVSQRDMACRLRKASQLGMDDQCRMVFQRGMAYRLPKAFQQEQPFKLVSP